jgi:hypothetical protein
MRRLTRPSDDSGTKKADSVGMWFMCGSCVSLEDIIQMLSQATVRESD